MEDREGLISASEAAQRLGKSREATVRGIQRGELEGVRRHGRWFVTQESLERSLETAER